MFSVVLDAAIYAPPNEDDDTLIGQRFRHATAARAHARVVAGAR